MTQTFGISVWADLKSDSGLGGKATLFLIVVADGFNKFDTAGQPCSYVGTTLVMHMSGSSARGRLE
ncbi:transposase [Zobellia uliginosa]|uniref:transposase n=1 Tax=Zobellia uliginosa TaxID=143224 RepID=UPI00158A8924|nr:transposase [Zobellia uliginosa]